MKIVTKNLLVETNTINLNRFAYRHSIEFEYCLVLKHILLYDEHYNRQREHISSLIENERLSRGIITFSVPGHRYDVYYINYKFENI